MTAIAKNTTTTATINMDGGACGVWNDGNESTVVRQTTDGKFAVINGKPTRDGSYRLIKLFSDKLNARRYNFAIHGDSLGE